ncbi:MAG: DUF4089 domain-containing protein [Tagaea sp.]|jgi:hypothetical protein|nr:DUF4089 domain-containing protein [Azospirillum sp.]MCZ8123966.1 DUF4089 domain-containing protein [Magnetospirillum sp.]
MDDIDAYIDRTAALLGLPLDPAHKPGVAANLGRTAAIAKLVTEFPLPDDVEPGPVWRP